MECRSRNSRFAALAGGALLLAGALPQTLWGRLPDLCPFHRMTGLPCPTCGLTRSWSALLHGHLHASMGFHAWGPGLLVGTVVGLGFWVWRGRWPRVPRFWAVAGGVGWASYALARMIGCLPSP